MEVRSGAGTFFVEIDKVTHEDGRVVLVGRVDDWDARTFAAPEEVLAILRAGLRPPVVGALAASILTKASQRLAGLVRRER